MRRALAFAVAGLLLSCAKAAPAPARTDAPLDFTLPSYPGRSPFALAGTRGDVVLVDVWATWCEPCRESLPRYQALAKTLGPRGLQVITLNVDGEAAVPKELPRFLEETQLTLPILLDTDAALSEGTLKVKVMPTAFLLDRRGVVRHVHEGFEAHTFGEVQAQLEALLAEPR